MLMTIPSVSMPNPSLEGGTKRQRQCLK